MNLSKKLGFSENTKLVIIHADDAGLSHSENRATMQALQKGIVNSYSIMVPCPWFFEIALFAKENPQYDHGVHLTLTCEWENYRFGPVLPVSEVPSLVDANGYFYKKREMLLKKADPEEVARELEAQLQRDLKFGLNPSHIDSHMYGVGASPAFFKIYKDLGKRFELPVFLNRQLMEMVGLSAAENLNSTDLIVEKAHFGKWEYFEQGTLRHYYEGIFADLAPGLNIILIHPAFDDEEMRGITVKHPNFGSVWRQIDFDYFTSEHAKSQFDRKDIAFITWRDLKNNLMD